MSNVTVFAQRPLTTQAGSNDIVPVCSAIEEGEEAAGGGGND